jgi:hypothetical protein
MVRPHDRAVQGSVAGFRLGGLGGDGVSSCPVSLFRKRQFDTTVIVTCGFWYVRFALTSVTLRNSWRSEARRSIIGQCGATR